MSLFSDCKEGPGGAHIWKSRFSLRSGRLPGSELPWSPAGGLEADARGDAQSTARALVLRLRPERCGAGFRFHADPGRFLWDPGGAGVPWRVGCLCGARCRTSHPSVPKAGRAAAPRGLTSSPRRSPIRAPSARLRPASYRVRGAPITPGAAASGASPGKEGPG